MLFVDTKVDVQYRNGGISPLCQHMPPLALLPSERKTVLNILHEDRFIDKAPQEIYATLLDEKRYVCSIRTMYRILEKEGEIKERRNQLIRPHYVKPELIAEAPNQVWSWDITKLKSTGKVDILLSICNSRHLQQICSGLDGSA